VRVGGAMRTASMLRQRLIQIGCRARLHCFREGGRVGIRIGQPQRKGPHACSGSRHGSKPCGLPPPGRASASLRSGIARAFPGPVCIDRSRFNITRFGTSSKSPCLICSYTEVRVFGSTGNPSALNSCFSCMADWNRIADMPSLCAASTLTARSSMNIAWRGEICRLSRQRP
jgi:hypothetical protein